MVVAPQSGRHFPPAAARQSLLPGTSDVAKYNGFNGTITGIVEAEPALREDRMQLRVASESIFVNSATLQTSGLVLVEADRGDAVHYGDRIRATGRLDVPASWDSVFLRRLFGASWRIHYHAARGSRPYR